jgi:HPt (histidine-containing phosphotransfer) domain-containing protein
MITMFLDVTPALVDRVENGIKLEDWEDVRSASHKMKPSLDIMGIESLHTVIRSIEQNAKKEPNLNDMHQLSSTLNSTLEKVYKELRDNELRTN